MPWAAGCFWRSRSGTPIAPATAGYLDYLHRHARFFILLTVVFGAISGVGIWWTIGLASPLATEVLIRTFVFGWATEWVFFVVEVTAAFIFYYYWGRLAEKTHVVIGWIYAVAAWISLVLITGITAFMLNPGVWADRPEVAGLLDGVLQSAVPAADDRPHRRGAAAELAVRVSARLADDPRRPAARHDRRAFGAAGLAGGGVDYGRRAGSGTTSCPPRPRAALSSAAALNILMALIFALTIVVFFLLYFGPYRNPGWLSPGFAGSLCLFGIAAFSTGEFIREAVRKPFVVYNVVLGNQMLPEQVQTLREQRLSGRRRVDQRPTWPSTIRRRSSTAASTGSELLKLPHEGPRRPGRGPVPVPLQRLPRRERGLFGRRAAAAAADRANWSARRSSISNRFSSCRPGAARPQEAELMTDYLMSINPPRPGGHARWESRRRR